MGGQNTGEGGAMSVLDGPRREMRRILFEGSVYGVTARDGGMLDLVRKTALGNDERLAPQLRQR